MFNKKQFDQTYVVKRKLLTSIGPDHLLKIPSNYNELGGR